MARKVHWLLDIDGVINARQPGKHNHLVPWERVVTRQVRSAGYMFDLTWSEELLDEIHALSRDHTNLEIFLSSTWVAHPEDLLKRLGSDWPAAFEVDQKIWGQKYRPFDYMWGLKRNAFIERANDRTPVIWTDDELFDIYPRLRHEDLPGTLDFCPNPESGLNRRHLQSIREFVEKYS